MENHVWSLYCVPVGYNVEKMSWHRRDFRIVRIFYCSNIYLCLCQQVHAEHLSPVGTGIYQLTEKLQTFSYLIHWQSQKCVLCLIMRIWRLIATANSTRVVWSVFSAHIRFLRNSGRNCSVLSRDGSAVDSVQAVRSFYHSHMLQRSKTQFYCNMTDY